MIILEGCYKMKSDSFKEKQNESLSYTDNNTPKTLKFSNTLDIYLDATPSMKGYINTPFVNFLVHYLPIVDSNPYQRCFRFDTRGVESTDVNRMEKIINPQFADDFFINDTYLDTAIRHTDTSNLSLVLTDLFQTDANLSQVTGMLLEKYLSHGLGIGICAIKLPFKGVIYDIGPRRYPKYFYGERPFYIIALGKTSEIARCFRNLKNSIDYLYPGKVPHFIIISNTMIGKPISFNKFRCSVDSISPSMSTKTIGNFSHNMCNQFLLRGSNKGPHFIDIKFTIDILPFCSLENYDITFERTRNYFLEERTSLFSSEKDTFVSVGTDDSIITVDGKPISTNYLQRRFTFLPLRFEKEGIYKFEYRISCKPNGVPDWVKYWNMPIDSIDGWHNQPNLFNGGTTYNLVPFITALYTYTSSELGRESLFIKKKD